MASLALVSENIRVLKKKKKKLKDLAKLGVTNIVGTEFTKEIAKSI